MPLWLRVRKWWPNIISANLLELEEPRKNEIESTRLRQMRHAIDARTANPFGPKRILLWNFIETDTFLRRSKFIKTTSMEINCVYHWRTLSSLCLFCARSNWMQRAICRSLWHIFKHYLMRWIGRSSSGILLCARSTHPFSNGFSSFL